jgi:hypothetical protein
MYNSRYFAVKPSPGFFVANLFIRITLPGSSGEGTTQIVGFKM